MGNNYYQPYGTYTGVNYQQPQSMQQAQPMQQFQTMQQPQSGGYSCRPVTCREEAVAAQVEYFSAGLIMPDLSHGVIYLKRFNSNTGASDFNEFKYCPPQPEMAAGIDPAQFVTRKEFEEFTRRMQAMKEAAEYDPI